jgi:hypothetical protein
MVLFGGEMVGLSAHIHKPTIDEMGSIVIITCVVVPGIVTQQLLGIQGVT